MTEWEHMYIPYCILIPIALLILCSEWQRNKLAVTYRKLGDDTNRRNWEVRESIREMDDVAADLDLLAKYPNSYSQEERKEIIDGSVVKIKSLKQLEIMSCYDTNTD